jgi:hypothetical protein
VLEASGDGMAGVIQRQGPMEGQAQVGINEGDPNGNQVDPSSGYEQDGRAHCLCSLPRPGAQGLTEDLGRIRDEHHGHQQHQIPVEEPMVDPLDVGESGVVVEPHDPDDQETDHVRGQRRPPV